ncbi:EAL domain-containing protein [Thiomonas sp. FB-6]|uniref:EAL domain-containing protein n=1 Tax=Thiomonas sp. FB-6 TaxID=1158291 RepID=UPI0003624C33|nr:EAL domain-containing protein [Thiomonas sp. FB-6]
MRDNQQALGPEAAEQPYGLRAAALLENAAEHFAQAGTEFVEAFYQGLAREPQSARILEALSAEQLRSLKARQAAHLQFLVHPGTTRDQLRQRAEAVGRVHALVGVGGSMLVRSQAQYGGLLARLGSRTGLSAEDRHALSRIVEQRLHDDIEGQTDATERVLGAYWRLLARPYVRAGAAWADASAEELEVLGALPGVRAALLLRLDQQGVLTVERSAGPQAREITEVMRDPGTSVLIDSQTPRGQGLVALAWRSGLAQSTPNYAADPRLGFWNGQATRLRVQSTFALPVCDEAGNVAACLYLYGAYPNQFEADWMREFGQGLQRRWEQTWRSSRSPSGFALPEERAEAYRACMFTGGLRMHLQPVFDLRSGEVDAVEALARLHMPDGSVVPPGQFLPLLGHAELDRLFQLGLGQALDWLVELSGQAARFARLGISINLPPSTLLNPDCTRWVDEALRSRGVEPERLHIELLETQELHSDSQRVGIEQLAGLGVRLSMDDLGSGYSSLERLSRLPFDVIKIDQGLLATLRTYPLRVISLVGSLIQVAHDLRRAAVVEGLEDADAVEAVSLLGATMGQGFGLCRPLPPEQASRWLREFRPQPTQASVSSHLGALAYHWRYVRALHVPPSHTDLATCPLTAFLRCAAPRDEAVARWHEQLHRGEEVDQASQHISDWLEASIVGS